mmetsp:Transcript_112746/g.318677  ORF Transcript_112746/g.318677 Transcript_112746/m.318677 type:complete len:939 (+) Transcript_112746:118-2934(+)
MIGEQTESRASPLLSSAAAGDAHVEMDSPQHESELPERRRASTEAVPPQLDPTSHEGASLEMGGAAMMDSLQQGNEQPGRRRASTVAVAPQLDRPRAQSCAPLSTTSVVNVEHTNSFPPSIRESTTLRVQRPRAATTAWMNLGTLENRLVSYRQRAARCVCCRRAREEQRPDALTRYVLDMLIEEEMRRHDNRKEQVRAMLEGVGEDMTMRSMQKVKNALGLNILRESHGHFSSIYWRLLWLRFPLAFIACALVLFALFSGMIMAVFLGTYQFTELRRTGKSYNLEAEKALPTVRFLFFVLPFCTVFASILINQCVILFFDSIGTTPLVLCRAKIMSGLCGVKPESPPSRKLCACVDLLLLLWLEGWPVFRMFSYQLAQTQFGVSALRAGYTQGLVEAAQVLALLVILAEFATSGRRLCRGRMERDAWLAYYLLKETMETQRMQPGGLLSERGMLAKYRAFEVTMTRIEAERLRQLFKSQHQRDPVFFLPEALPNSCSRQLLRLIACCGGPVRLLIGTLSVALWWFVSSYTFMADEDHVMHISIAAFLSSVSVLGVAYMAANVLRTSSTKTGYSAVVVILLSLQVALLWSTSVNVAQQDLAPLMLSHMQALMIPHGGNSSWGLKTEWENAHDVRPYPVCRTTWGAADAPLSVLDLSALSWISYQPECWSPKECGAAQSVECLLRQTFGSRAPVLEFCSGYYDFPRSIVVRFPGSDGRNGTRVVAVKGTSTTLDFYVDTDTYATIQVLQWMDSTVVPVLSYFPIDLVQQYLSLSSTEWGIGQPLDDLVQNVSRMSHFLGRPAPDAHLVVTGHSLGGGFAQAVAARLGKDSFLLSAPGDTFLAKAFKISWQPGQKTVTVWPEKDLVPQVDVHSGVVQHILCRDKQGRLEVAPACHALVKTACELWRVCGDAPYHRNFTASCEPFVTNELLGHNFPFHNLE